jgi:hypothetical protein
MFAAFDAGNGRGRGNFRHRVKNLDEVLIIDPA